MDQMIDQLFQLEQQAVQTENRVQTQKLAMKQQFNQKKEDQLAQLQADFDQKLTDFKSRQNQESEKILLERQRYFDQQMANIQISMDNEQANYIAQFMEKVKALGVNGNE